MTGAGLRGKVPLCLPVFLDTQPTNSENLLQSTLETNLLSSRRSSVKQKPGTECSHVFTAGRRRCENLCPLLAFDRRSGSSGFLGAAELRVRSPLSIIRVSSRTGGSSFRRQTFEGANLCDTVLPLPLSHITAELLLCKWNFLRDPPTSPPCCDCKRS